MIAEPLFSVAGNGFWLCQVCVLDLRPPSESSPYPSPSLLGLQCWLAGEALLLRVWGPASSPSQSTGMSCVPPIHLVFCQSLPVANVPEAGSSEVEPPQ